MMAAVGAFFFRFVVEPYLLSHRESFARAPIPARWRNSNKPTATGQIVRNHSPRASAAGDIENGIEDLAAAITRRASHFASRGEELTDDIPLSIRNIAGIRSSLWHPKFCTTKYIQCTAFLSRSFSAAYAFPIVMQTFFTASQTLFFS